MENIIKNLHKLKGLLSEEQLERLEGSAILHRRYSHIFFKVLEINTDDKILNVQISQEKSPSDNYADGKRMVDIVEETFRPYFEGWQIRKVTYPYIQSPAEEVTPEWIQERMNRYKIGNKQLVSDLGIAKAEISALINGHREMGIRTKGLFYYYFKYKEATFNKKV